MIGMRTGTLKGMAVMAMAIAVAILFCATGVRPAIGAEPAGETPPKGWIIVTSAKGSLGPLKNVAGLQVFTRTSGPDELAFPDDNTTTGASGRIRAAHEGYCNCVHYHGSLFGLPDPDEEHCGWGCVVPIETAPPALVEVSDALMFEGEAALHVLLKGNLPDAISAIEDSIDALDRALGNLPESGDQQWDKKDAKKLKKSIKKALKSD